MKAPKMKLFKAKEVGTESNIHISGSGTGFDAAKAAFNSEVEEWHSTLPKKEKAGNELHT
jgi:hypothetical protein